MSEENTKGLGKVEGKRQYLYLLPYCFVLHPGSQSLGGKGETYQSCAIIQVKFKQLNKAGVCSGCLRVWFVNFYSFSLLINILVSSGLHTELRCKS